MKKAIILIGGAPGVGKTTVSRQLCHALDIDHRISTGFLREIVRDQVPSATCPALFSSTFGAADPVATLTTQAAYVERSVRLCIERAQREGTSLIMEGNHLIPGLYHDMPCHLYVVVAAPTALEHYQRLGGRTHLLRQVTRGDLAGARAIDRFLGSEATRYGIPYQPYLSGIEAFTDLMADSDP